MENNFEGQEPQPITPGNPESDNTEKQAAKPKINKKFLIGGAVLVVVLIAGIGYLGMQIYQNNETESTNDAPGEVAGVKSTGPVAVVDGVEISRDRFDFRYNLEAKGAPSRGLDLNDNNTQDLFARQILDNVVTVELLLQQAEAAGISTTNEAVDAQFQVVVETLGGEESFNEQLAADGISSEELRNDIREQLIIENFVKYYADSVGIEVTDEEVQAAYDDASLTNEDLPPFETVAEQIKDQMLQQRSVEAVNQLIESIKETSVIQLLL